MVDRRLFLGLTGGSLAAPSLAFASTTAAPRRLSVITTEWRYRSHAWHMGERFLAGFPKQGEWRRSPFQVVSAYVDQFPKNDLSRTRAEEFGFRIYPSIAEALRLGGDKLSVDAVLIIGEHGDYPNNDIGQKLYPRYEFFKQVVNVFREDDKAAPVFNDKHLSWKWAWAKEMVATAKEMNVPFLAGSSLPVTWRMPAIDIPHGEPVDEVMCVAMGGVDSYDFHALEVIQCMAERRKGGETGVKWVQSIRGREVWEAMAKGSFESGGWNPQLFEACLSRSQTLSQAPTNSHRYPTLEQMKKWVADPIIYRIKYNDGLSATMMLLNGLVGDFTFAAKLRSETKPLSTLFYLPPGPNVQYSAELMSGAEQMFLTGKAPYPVERTLLTSGLVEAGVKSLATGQRVVTPHLDVRYAAPKQSLFADK